MLPQRQDTFRGPGTMDYRGIRIPPLDPFLARMEQGAADGQADALIETKGTSP